MVNFLNGHQLQSFLVSSFANNSKGATSNFLFNGISDLPFEFIAILLVPAAVQGVFSLVEKLVGCKSLVGGELVVVICLGVKLGCGFQRNSADGLISFGGEGVVVIVDPFVFGQWLLGSGVVERALLGFVGFGLDAAARIAVLSPLDFDFQIQHPTSIMNQIIYSTALTS